MFKKHLHLLIVFAWLTAASLPFQNCGAQSSFKSSEQTVQMSVSDFDQDFDEDHDVVNKSIVAGTSYEPILADRYYIDQLFLDIFGPTARAVDGGGTANNGVIHGAPCSVYEDHAVYDSKTGKYVRTSAEETCGNASPNLLVAEINPKASVTRQALLARSCADLTTNAATFRYAMSRISTQALPSPTEENIRTLLKLFYRTQPEPHQGLVDSLVVMLPAAGVTENDWRLVVYTVCMSSFWQVL